MLEIKKLPSGAVFDVEYLPPGSLPETPTPHRHDYFEIFWVLSGEGQHSIDFTEYSMSANRMFFITPGQVHDVHQLPDSLYAISFNAEFVNGQGASQLPLDKLFLQQQSGSPFVDLDTLGQTQMLNLLDILQRELQAQTPDKTMMSTLFISMLRYVVRYSNGDELGLSNADKRMVRLLKLIEQHYAEEREVGFYSDRLALTSKRLNELSKAQFSKTVTQLIHHKVIVEARRMLAFTEQRVKAISLQLGYCDTSYFCRFFKRHSGVTPQDFRRNWHNQHHRE